jgi:hypothetical protein
LPNSGFLACVVVIRELSFDLWKCAQQSWKLNE